MAASISLPLLTSGRKKQWSYSSLFFSLFYFVPLLFGALPDFKTSAIIAGLYLGFVSLYLTTIHLPHHRLLYGLGAMLTLAYVASVFSPGGAVIFGFIAFIVGYYYRTLISTLFIVFIVASLVVLQSSIFAGQTYFFIASAVNVIVLFGFGVMERKETIHQILEANQAASLSTLTAIAERERIGRDLHDVAGHALSSISLKAQVAEKLLEKGQIDNAKKEVAELSRLSQSLLSEIRQTVSGIKHLTSHEELTRLVNKLTENSIVVNADLNKSALGMLSPLQETQLALIAREAITNILRHSDANEVSLRVYTQTNCVHMKISDNGQNQINKEGNGIKGMRERAQEIQGTLLISRSNNTEIHLTIPVVTS